MYDASGAAIAVRAAPHPRIAASAVRVVYAAVIIAVLACPAVLLVGARIPVEGENLDQWVESNIGFRAEIIDAYSRLNETLFHVSGEEQVIVGRDGFLFFAPTLPGYLGRSPAKGETIDGIADKLAELCGVLAEYDVGFIMVIAPNKSSIYPEYMPYYLRPAAGASDAKRLLDALALRGVYAPDLFSALALHKEDGPLYYRTDTHWNPRGAFYAYRMLMAIMRIETRAFVNDAYDTGEWANADMRGDLAAMYMPVSASRERYETPVVERRYAASGVIRTLMDPHIETASQVNDLSVYMLRDSFGEGLFPYMANNVGRLVMSRVPPSDDNWTDGTDYFIWEIVERDLLEIAPRVDAMLNAMGR